MASNILIDTIKCLINFHHFTVTRNTVQRVSTPIGDMLTGMVNLDNPDKTVDVAVFLKSDGNIDYFELWDKADESFDHEMPRICESDASDAFGLAMLIACEAVSLHERVAVALEEGR